MEIDLLNELHKKTEIKDSHWLYIGTLKSKRGWYGLYSKDYKKYLVHRLSLAIFLKLDYNDHTWEAAHICKYRNCWNPLHIYQGTHIENCTDRDVNGNKGSLFHKNKTHCKQGHEFTIGNTYKTPEGKRACIACNKVAVKKYQFHYHKRKVNGEATSS